MTRADLADKIQESISCQKKEALELVDLALEILKEAIAIEEHMKIRGFGN
jgi:integration host factor subunit alpha